MAIDTSAIASALAVDNSPFIIDKASLANGVAGTLYSLWRATGQPTQGAIPTAAAVCTKALTGAVQFENQTAPKSTFLGSLAITNSNNSGMSFLIRDRIAHMAGLVLNVTTSQTTNLPIDLQTLAPPAARLGAADYSDIEWFLDVYTDGGGTASNATVNVTYNDGTTGNLSVIPVGGTLRVGRSISLTPFKPFASPARYIRGINSVILSASTGTAGNVGFTARRHRGKVPMSTANLAGTFDWAQCKLAQFPNDACMEFMVQCSTTSTGAIRGEGALLHLTP
jgi:hypothetical protein